MHVYILPQHVLCLKDDITEIILISYEGKSARMYPLFVVNELGGCADLFKDVFFPEGTNNVSSWRKYSDSAVTSCASNFQFPNYNVDYCQGLRIDAENGFDTDGFIENLLEQITQHTHQWWLRSNISPFNGMQRFAVDIDKDFKFREDLRYSGAKEIESTWGAVRQTQNLIGIEKPLDRNKWRLVCLNAADSSNICQGIISFHDALSFYSSRNDTQCVINLCICFEILGNKRRIILGHNPMKADKLIKGTDLVTAANKSIIDDMFVDRGHIAHGRDFHILDKKKGRAIEDYIEVVRGTVSNYLSKLDPVDWGRASELEIKRQKKTS